MIKKHSIDYIRNIEWTRVKLWAADTILKLIHCFDQKVSTKWKFMTKVYFFCVTNDLLEKFMNNLSTVKRFAVDDSNVADILNLLGFSQS